MAGLVVEVLRDAARAVGAQREPPGRVVAHARVLVALRIEDVDEAEFHLRFARVGREGLTGEVQAPGVPDALGDVAVAVVALRDHGAGAVDAVAHPAGCVIDSARDHVRGVGRVRARLRVGAHGPAGHGQALGVGRALDDPARAVVGEAHHVARAVDRGGDAVVRVVDAVFGLVLRRVGALEAVELRFRRIHRQALRGRDDRGVARLPHHAAGRIVSRLGQVARRIQHEALAAFGVVGVARGVPLRIGGTGDVAQRIVGIAFGEVQARVRGGGRVHHFQHPAAQGVVFVAGDRAVGVGDAHLPAGAVVGEGGDEVQARGVHRLADELALGVVAELGDHALRIRHAQLVAQRVVGVAGDQVQAQRVHGAGEHPAGRVVAEQGHHAVGVRRLDQPPGHVVEARRARERRLHRRLVAVGVVFVAGGRSAAVRDRDGLAQAVVHGGDADAFGRDDGEAAFVRVVGVGGRVAQRVGLGDGAAEGVVAARAAAAHRVREDDGAAQAVVGLRARGAQRIGAGRHAAEGVVGDGSRRLQAIGVLHGLHGQAAVVVGGGDRLAAARAPDLFAEGVVDVIAREAQRIGHLRQRARGVVAVAGGAIGRVVARFVERGQHAGVGDAPGRAGGVGQGKEIEPVGVADARLHLAEGVVAGFRDLAQGVDGVREAAGGIVEELGLQAVLVGGAGAPACRVVGVAQAVLLPDRFELRIALPGCPGTRQLRRALRGELAHEAALGVVAHAGGARLRGARGLHGLHQPAHGVVAVARGGAFGVHRQHHAVECVVGARADLVLRGDTGQEVLQPRGGRDLRGRGGSHRRRVAPHGGEVAVRVVAALGEVALGIEFAHAPALRVVESGRVRVARAGGRAQARKGACARRSQAGGRAARHGLGVAHAADHPAGRVVAVLGQVAFAVHRAQQQAVAAMDLAGRAVLRAADLRRQDLAREGLAIQGAGRAAGMGIVAEVHGPEAVRAGLRHIDIQHREAVHQIDRAQHLVAVVEGYASRGLIARHLRAEQRSQALGRSVGRGAEHDRRGALRRREGQHEAELGGAEADVCGIVGRQLVASGRQTAGGHGCYAVHDAGDGDDIVSIDQGDDATGATTHRDGDVLPLRQAGIRRQAEHDRAGRGHGLRQRRRSTRGIAGVSLIAGTQFMRAGRQPSDHEASHAIKDLRGAQYRIAPQEGDGAAGLSSRHACTQRDRRIRAHARGRTGQRDRGGSGQHGRSRGLRGAGSETLESIVDRGQGTWGHIGQREPGHAVGSLHGSDKGAAGIEAHAARNAGVPAAGGDGGIEYQRRACRQGAAGCREDGLRCRSRDGQRRRGAPAGGFGPGIAREGRSDGARSHRQCR